MPIPTAPGIYPGLSFPQYARIDAMNHHGLETFRESPKVYQYRKGRPQEDRDAFRQGALFHGLCLESPKFNEQFAIRPAANRARNDGLISLIHWHEDELGVSRTDTDGMKQGDMKPILKGLEEQMFRSGKEVVTLADMTLATSMMEAAHQHPNFQGLRFQDDAQTELSMIALLDGVLCKARIDLLVPNHGIMVDAKTTRHRIGSPQFLKDAANLGYHRQAAHYKAVAEANGFEINQNFLFVVSKEEPHEAGLYLISPNAGMVGAAENVEALSRFDECTKADKWPGVSTDVLDFDLPHWYKSKEL